MSFDPNKRYPLLPETRAYLKDWYEWVERGAPDHEPYSRGIGLCHNFGLATARISDDLHECFRKAFRGMRNYEYPFGISEYVHKSGPADPNRLAFVRANMEPD